MEKTFNPAILEPHWRAEWAALSLGQPRGEGPSFCIVLPPPNVTGTLHMGHGFQQTLMDALIRYHHLKGNCTLWQGGTDHAGIATQMVVERQLSTQGISRHDIGRERFLEAVWAWRAQSGNMITSQMQRLGVAIDWSRERFTMDAVISKATYTAFCRLFDEGLIYRGQKLVNWDPVLQTAISDLEVESREVAGHLWHIRYPLATGEGHITVATTRPETLFGDVAVAVHPEDTRYMSLIGKQLRLPLTDRTIPIIADATVDPTFGTGCVKITPAHDFNDYAMGARHNLPLLNILTADAHLNDTVPTAYQGLERFACRKQVISDLTTQGLLEKTVDHRMQVPYGDRSGVVIEPRLTYQWFVNMKPLAERALAELDHNKPHFVPENWNKTYRLWLENIQDWCISRQLWWGHRIPVWYDEHGTAYAGLTEQDARTRHHLDAAVALTQDQDVLDTWFSASLWPFASLGWPDDTADFKRFFPTQVLVTGFDIIFFWVARMSMMSLHLTGHIPFETVYITGLIRDSQGQKMSKSKGNILDPIDLIDGIDLELLVQKRTTGLMQPQLAEAIEKNTRREFPEGIPACGTDALRFTFCALANTGRDINFEKGRIEGYRNFCNKLWNAARFVLMHTEKFKLADRVHSDLVADRWIRSQLSHTIDRVHAHFAEFRFDLLAQALYAFVWNDYCDWYLECLKVTLQDPTRSYAEQQNAQFTALSVLEITLRLLNPIMPFITEALWQEVGPKLGYRTRSITELSFPTRETAMQDLTAEVEMAWILRFVTSVRTLRSETGISPCVMITLIVDHMVPTDERALKTHGRLLKTLL
ncbi:MAG: valine--tRNA ligase, partial [Gammaproteobacteria bacterium RIFCSPHIGHO2_12_FULL_45_9]